VLTSRCDFRRARLDTCALTRAFALVLLLASLPIGAQSSQPPQSTPVAASYARVMLELDSTTIARFDAREFDLGVTHLATAQSGVAASSAEIRLVKQAGAYSGELVRLSASGSRAPRAIIEVMDSTGAPSMRVSLFDVTVISDHIALSTAREALEQQRISQQDALTQLTTDSQQAQRDLSTAEELGKSRVTTRQELARARERAADLQQRVALARQRQALLARQLSSRGLLDESIVLRFARLEIDSPAPGGRTAWDFTSRSTPSPRATPRLP